MQWIFFNLTKRYWCHFWHATSGNWQLLSLQLRVEDSLSILLQTVNPIYTLFQKGSHFCILLFVCKITLVASFFSWKFKTDYLTLNLQSNKIIPKWWQLWNKVYWTSHIFVLSLHQTAESFAKNIKKVHNYFSEVLTNILIKFVIVDEIM